MKTIYFACLLFLCAYATIKNPSVACTDVSNTCIFSLVGGSNAPYIMSGDDVNVQCGKWKNHAQSRNSIVWKSPPISAMELARCCNGPCDIHTEYDHSKHDFHVIHNIDKDQVLEDKNQIMVATHVHMIDMPTSEHLMLFINASMSPTMHTTAAIVHTLDHVRVDNMQLIDGVMWLNTASPIGLLHAPPAMTSVHNKHTTSNGDVVYQSWAVPSDSNTGKHHTLELLNNQHAPKITISIASIGHVHRRF